MPKGPLGGPRPLSEYRLIIDPHRREVELIKVGPLGIERPFAKNNPPISQDRINECVISESGRSFGASVVSKGQTDDISDLPPLQREEAIELAESWCEGTLEATSMEDLEEGQATRLRNTVESQIEQMIETGREFNVTAIPNRG